MDKLITDFNLIMDHLGNRLFYQYVVINKDPVHFTIYITSISYLRNTLSYFIIDLRTHTC